MFERILLRVSHHHLVVGDNVNSEWGEPGWKRRIHERCSGESSGIEPGVVGLNISGVEIRGQNEITRVILNNRKPFVDRSRRGIVYREDGVYIHSIPSGDRPVFGSEDKTATDVIDVETG